MNSQLIMLWSNELSRHFLLSAQEEIPILEVLNLCRYWCFSVVSCDIKSYQLPRWYTCQGTGIRVSHNHKISINVWS